jgi:hypothetical protein
MINHLGGDFFHPRQMNASSEVASLDQRLRSSENDAKTDEDINELYAQLKLLWEGNPEIRSEEIIDYLRKYTVADAGSPYKNSSTHVHVLAQLLEILKKEGGEASPIYETLNKGLRSAVVYNGILNGFQIAMIMRPEEPEGWA